MSAPAALDRFFASFYARRPVTATFTGIHDHDSTLPDWSPEGLRAAADEMRGLRGELEAAGRVPDDAVEHFPDEVDLALADACLEIKIAEHEGQHFYRRNPALWTGEAIFSIVSLVTRPFAPIDDRLRSAAARLASIPAFLDAGARTLESSPAEWRARALRECEAAEILFGRSLPRWLPDRGGAPPARCTRRGRARRRRATRFALRALARATDSASTPADTAPARAALSLLVRRGHWCATPLEVLARAAGAALRRGACRISTTGAAPRRGAVGRRSRRGSPRERPAPDDYLPRFARDVAALPRRGRRVRPGDLARCADSLRADPDAHARCGAAALLPVLPIAGAVRSAGVHDYVVSPIDGLPDEEVDAAARGRERLRDRA